MGLQIPLYQQPERHYERRATPPQPDRTSKVCLPSNPETKAKCPFLIQAFVNLKLNVSTYKYKYIYTYIYIYVRSLLILSTYIYTYIYSKFLLRLLIIVTMFIMAVFYDWLIIRCRLVWKFPIYYHRENVHSLAVWSSFFIFLFFSFVLFSLSIEGYCFDTPYTTP